MVYIIVIKYHDQKQFKEKGFILSSRETRAGTQGRFLAFVELLDQHPPHHPCNCQPGGSLSLKTPCNLHLWGVFLFKHSLDSFIQTQFEFWSCWVVSVLYPVTPAHKIRINWNHPFAQLQKILKGFLHAVEEEIPNTCSFQSSGKSKPHRRHRWIN